MFKKAAKLIPVSVLTLLLTSCAGKEPDNIAYITALGIDKSDGGYTYTIQLANPSKISGGASEEGGSGGNIVENIAVESSTLYSALSGANAIVSKDLSLSHAKLFVFSEETAKNGLDAINDVFARNNDIRPDIFYAVAEDAGEYLEEVKPMIELNPVKYYQLTYDSDSGCSVPKNDAADFFSNCVSGDSDTLLPLAGTATAEESGESSGETDSSGSSGGGSKGNEESSGTNERQKDAETNVGGFENRTKNYLAGEAGETIKNKSEALGAAVFRGDRFIGKIGGTETEICNILSGKSGTADIAFYNDADPDTPFAMRVEERGKPKYIIDTARKHITINVRLDCRLLSETENGTHLEDVTEQKAETMIDDYAKEIAEKLYHEMNADVLGICGKSKAKFLTQDGYEEFKAAFNPKEWDFEIDTDVKLARTGMIFQ